MSSSGAVTAPRRPARTGSLLVALALCLAIWSPGSADAEEGDAGGAVSVQEQAAAARARAGRVLIAWEPGTSPGARADVVRHAVGDQSVLERVTDGIDAIEVDPARAGAVVSALTADPRVDLAERDHQLRVAAADAPEPDDELFDLQWGLHNDGQESGSQGSAGEPGIDINIREAWEVTRGEPEVVVAVIDTGIDPNHPDLDGALWTNPDETTDGRDEDDNGYVDDVNGWNFADQSPDVFVSAEEDNHGTAVAGVIAARSDDQGIAGVAPRVEVMALKAFANLDGTGGAGDLSDVVEAFGYAVEQGADVINASWVTPEDSKMLRRVIERAEVPVVAAAGNRARDLDAGAGRVYPAGWDLDNLVTVTAVDNRGEVPGFANVGARTVDLAAPGSDVATTTTTPAGWSYVDGTSFAAPHVCGAVALARSVAPDASTADLLDAVVRTTRVTDGLDGAARSSGMLDAGHLVDAVIEPVCGDAPPAGFVDVDPGNVHAEAIGCVTRAGLAEGRTSERFAPRQPVTRGQVASFLARLVEAEGGAPEDPPDAFDDDDGNTHEDAIDVLADLGIVEGDRSGDVGPARAVTRAQIASLVVRTYAVISDPGAARPVGQLPGPTRDWFRDDDASDHARAIDLARDLGIVRGIGPVSYATAADTERDQMASILARLLDELAR